LTFSRQLKKLVLEKNQIGGEKFFLGRQACQI